MPLRLLDASEELGQLFINAVKRRDVALLNSLLRKPLLWRKYMNRLTNEEGRWASNNIKSS